MPSKHLTCYTISLPPYIIIFNLKSLRMEDDESKDSTSYDARRSKNYLEGVISGMLYLFQMACGRLQNSQEQVKVEYDILQPYFREEFIVIEYYDSEDY